jgi:riboflavin kinase/FMN adenylyltransferase
VNVITSATREAVAAALGDRRTVITIGAYDGVHLGHRAVISQVRARAQQLGAASVVVTFDRHPASVVRPDSAPKLLTDTEQKLQLLATTEVDGTLVVPFDSKQATEPANKFVQRVLVDALAVQSIIVGEDFHFGYQRSGNVQLLQNLSTQFAYDVMPVRLVERSDGVDEPISSTAIRRALAGGDVTRAAAMLGRNHEVRGVVGHGDQRGRTIGFPTANVQIDVSICLPADGVYAAFVTLDDGAVHPAAVNLGRRPTFHDRADASLLEAHLLDFSGDLYGRRLSVAFQAFLRGERKFSGVDELKAQLAIDIAHAREALR